jgi:hypothetical protein
MLDYLLHMQAKLANWTDSTQNCVFLLAAACYNKQDIVSCFYILLMISISVLVVFNLVRILWKVNK